VSVYMSIFPHVSSSLSFLSQVSFKISLSIDVTNVFFDMDLDWKTTISRDFIGNINDDFKKVLRSLARLFRAENLYLVCAVFPSDINWIWNCILSFYSRSSQNYAALDNRIRDFPRKETRWKVRMMACKPRWWTRISPNKNQRAHCPSCLTSWSTGRHVFTDRQ